MTTLCRNDKPRFHPDGHTGTVHWGLDRIRPIMLAASVLALAFCLTGCDTEVNPKKNDANVGTPKEPNPAPARVETQITAPEQMTPTDTSLQTVDPNSETPTQKGTALSHPDLANETSPEKFTVRVETTKGPVEILVERAWSPRGADRFYNLVKIGYLEDIAMFRVVEGFMVQFGIHGDPDISHAWQSATIKDDPVQKSNTRGTLTFATSGKNSRTTQMFINYGDNSRLDGMGFSPIGKVIAGMSAVDSAFSDYGETPDQGRIQATGNSYLKQNFPKLDYIQSATLVE